MKLQQLYRQFLWGWSILAIPVNVGTNIAVWSIYLHISTAMFVPFLLVGVPVVLASAIMLGRFYKRFQLKTDTVYGYGPLIEELKAVIREEMQKLSTSDQV